VCPSVGSAVCTSTGQWRRQDFSLGGVSRRRGGKAQRGVGCGEEVSPSTPEEGSGEGGVPPPQEIFDYLILKWRILMHISGILTYLFQSSALQRKAEYRKTSDRSPRLLSVQVSQTPGLYAGSGDYPGPGFY